MAIVRKSFFDNIKLRRLMNDKTIPDHIKNSWIEYRTANFKDIIKYPALRKYASAYSFSGISANLDSSYESSNLINFMGFDNAIKLFDEYPNFVSYLVDSSNFIYLAEPAEEVRDSYEKAKKRLFAYLNSYFSEFKSCGFDADSFPEEMKELYPDLFIQSSERQNSNENDINSNSGLPDEVVKRYYDGELLFSDLRKYKNILKNKNLNFGLRKRLEICKGFDSFFGFDAIWDIVDYFPVELDWELREYFGFAGRTLPDGYSFPSKRDSEIEIDRINEIIGLALQYIIDVEREYPSNFKEVYTYTKYLPCEKVIQNSRLCKFISRCGIDNLFEFNKKHNNILFDEEEDNKGVPAFFRTLGKRNFISLLDFVDENAEISTQEGLYKAFSDAIYKCKVLGHTHMLDYEELCKEFPEYNLDKELFYSLADKYLRPSDPNYDWLDGEYNIDELYKSLVNMVNGNYPDHRLSYLSLINKYPEFKSLFLDKRISFFVHSNIGELYHTLQNHMFLELCTKYGEYLQKNSDFNIVDNLLKIDYSGDYETDINIYIYNTLFKKYWNASNLTLSLLPKSFQERYPKLFLLNEEVPDEIRKKYLNRELYLQDFIDNSELLIYFKNVNIYNGLNVDSGEREIVELYLYNRGTYDYSLINNNIIFLLKAYRNYQTINITTIINTIIQEEDKLLNDSIIEEYIYDYYVNRGNNSIKIPLSNFPEDFQKRYPELFLLGVDVPDEIREKYLYGDLELQDFIDNPELINCFNKTNIMNGFQSDYWISCLYEFADGKHDMSFINHNELVILKVLNNIVDLDYNKVIRDEIAKYVKEHPDELLNENTFDKLIKLAIRVNYSNSIEISLFKEQLLSKLVKLDNPFETLDKIERIFLKNNLPLCGKMFNCFKILYPEYGDVDEHHLRFDDASRLAPELLDSHLPNLGLHSSNEEKRDIIEFNDLLRLSYRSGERSLIEYLDNIEKGYELFLKVRDNGFSISNLSDDEKNILEIFASHLETLFYNTKKGQVILKYTKENKEYGDQISNSPLGLRLLMFTNDYKDNERYTMKDRIVRSFCYFAGIDSFDELRKLISDSAEEQKKRKDKFIEELEKNGGVFKFQEGDFVRGIGCLDALSGSLGTGNYCKEHLGVFRGVSYSDTTPLDVDITLIEGPIIDIYNSIDGTPTGFGFGNIYVIIKKDNPNFRITRDVHGNFTDAKYDPKTVELFSTGYHTHWGARTGISLADIDCILYKDLRQIDKKDMYDKDGNIKYIGNSSASDLPAVKFSIAKNGYYIPVIDFSGKLIFTEEEFNMLRGKMQGLSYYGEKNYNLSSELVIPDVESIAQSINEDSINYTNERRNKIYSVIKKVMDDLNLEMKCQISNDLSSGSIEIIDTGSTGRNTNIPYDGDYDFFMRVDADIIRKSSAFSKFKYLIESAFHEYGDISVGYTDKGDLRLDGICLDPDKPDEKIKVDISFGVKTNKVQYSSDICLSDRLETIKELYPNQYKYVIANIILAKKVLKGSSSEEAAYKPHRTDPNQGGLGGIGIENWVLQNGGSFVQACRSFLEAATDKKTGKIIPYEDFIRKYEIWDFGENHFTIRNIDIGEVGSHDPTLDQIKKFPYDNFVFNNMNSTGYRKMIKIIKEYLEKIEFEKVGQKSATI